ncbi:hypothetical protein HPSA50_0509 [Helicobacter pylori SouthAfrica50]|uniref:Uncharacterized protein n=1 Tax=Helicobacter pylori SouthAfrica50 TaxID=1352357 RepID=T2SCZ2_HELPX|nr:hypothetical protein HPSA50_0509 [Helicobacter pylori SouthAfrica50]
MYAELTAKTDNKTPVKICFFIRKLLVMVLKARELYFSKVNE